MSPGICGPGIAADPAWPRRDVTTVPKAWSSVLASHRDGVVLAVIATPRAGVTALAGIDGGGLQVRVAAPPVDGAANAALVRYLANVLGLPKGHVKVLAGQAGRRKRILVSGLTETEVGARLAAAAPILDGRPGG